MKRAEESVRRIIKDIKEYGVAGIIFLVYYLIVHLFRSAFCPMLALTGLPCAGCGLTRAFLCIFTGQWKRAAYIHPLSFLIIVFLLYCGYFRYIKGAKIKGFTPLFIALVTVLLVFYGIRMYLYFPDRVPYVYMSDNVLADKVPEYEKLINQLTEIIRASRR